MAFNAHREKFEPVCKEIRDLASPFEDIILSADKNALKAAYPEMMVISSLPDPTFLNILVKLSSTRFVLFHQYREYNTDEQFIIEGEISRARDYINVHKFNCINYYDYNGERRNWQITDIDSYFDEYPGVNNIPFEYIIQVMSPDAETISYRKSLVYSRWNDPFGVIDKITHA